MDNSNNPLPINPDYNPWLDLPQTAEGRPIVSVGIAQNKDQPDYDPTQAEVYGNGEILKSIRNAADNLFGLNGKPRYQLFPERLVRSAITAPADALAGKITTYDEEIPRALDMAALAGGGSIPASLTREGTIGVFGGRLAQTANLEKLKQAEELAKNNTSPFQILQQTGWFQGADNQWRFEIPDTNANALQKSMGEINLPETRPTKLSEAINHPALFEAYPELKDLPIKILDNNFEQPNVATPIRNSAGYGEQINSKLELEPMIQIGDMNYVNMGSNRPTSVLLHEIQHAIQAKEGFTSGAPGFNQPRQEYLNTAGEVEARNVQARQNMSELERQLNPPWLSQDIPFDKQIISNNPKGFQASTNAPVFYSGVENAVKNAKIDNAPVSQWLGYLKNQPGVKQEELDWTLGGLDPAQKMSRQDLQQYVDANKINLNEVNKGELQFNKNGDTIPTGISKFSLYQLPGGSNYKEMLLQLPKYSEAQRYRDFLADKYKNEGGNFVDKASKEEQNKLYSLMQNPLNNFQSSHWDEPNVLAHARMNDRIVDGAKTLHLEEIQSDWHQKGRQQGYKLTPQQEKAFQDIDNKIIASGNEEVMGDPDIKSAIAKAIDKKIITADEGKTYLQNYRGADAQNSVPNAPFKTSWPDLVLKRMIRYAADNGYDAISWTPGEAQALRYQNEIRQKINAVEWHNKSMGKVNPDGSKQILVEPSHGSEIELTVDKNGIISAGHPELKGKRLDTVLGKDIASQVLEKNEGNVDAKNYVMNSEPMKAFYDSSPTKQGLVDKANAIAKKYGGQVEEKNLKIQVKPPRNEPQDKYNKAFNNYNIHFLRLPQKLKDTAQQKGFPLFSGGFMLQPSQNNPFANESVTIDGKQIPINNKQDVMWGAGASNNSDIVNIDKRIPRTDPKFKLKNGELGDIHKYLAIHELTEKTGMEEDIAAFKQQNGRDPNQQELNKIYLKNHYDKATPAEHKAIIADGGNPKDYEDVLHGYEKQTEHEHGNIDAPSDLYKKVYNHNQLRKMKLSPVTYNPFTDT